MEMSSNIKESKSAATIRRRRRSRSSPQHIANGNVALSHKPRQVVDELLEEDVEVYEDKDTSFQGPPIIKLLMSNDWILFLGLLALRFVNAIVIQTSFVPDEYWQSMEVAHKMTFGYGYLTWEWRNGLRGYFYPLMISVLYKLAAVLHLDNRIFLTKLPRLMQGVFAAIGDLYLYKMSRKLSGVQVARWTLLCQLTSWFHFYTSVRVLTNSMETSLTCVGLYYFPWPGVPRKAQWKYMCIVCIAVIIRPTAAIVWLPLCAWHIWLYRHKFFRVIVLFFIVGAGVLLVSLWVDKVFYGSWTNVQFNFLRFNVLSNLSTFYGSHPWHWYLTQGFPVILGSHIIPFLLGLKRFDQPFLTAVIVWTVSIYSVLGHKEFRFIYPLLPIAMYLSGLYLHSITCTESQQQTSGVEDTSDEQTTTQSVINQEEPEKRDKTHAQISQKQGNHSWFYVSPRSIVVFLIVTNLPVTLYTCLLHQRGTIDVMKFIHDETKYEGGKFNQMNVMFLMPCHSTPFYSYIHKNITMRFLTCEPPLDFTLRQDYLDEADQFYTNPYKWLEEEYEAGDKDNGFLPTHLVMFNVLYPSIIKFIEKNSYVECAKLFHSHITEGRVGNHVIVYCSRYWLEKKDTVKKNRQFLHLGL